MNKEIRSEYPCPCCGFLMFGEPPGSYEICSICNWEDDHVQLRFPAMAGGANKESLYEAQQTWLTKIPLDVREYNGFVRDNDWRPLGHNECKSPVPESGREYFDAAAQEPPDYYWKK